jgi:transcriptional regulator with XRE-family HTH domain
MMPSSLVKEPPGRMLRAHRRRQELTLREVAEEIGCSLSYLSKLESGQAFPKRTAMLLKMADVLRLDGREREALVEAARYAKGALHVPSGVGPRRCELAHRIISALPELSEETLDSIEELLREEKIMP